MKPRRTRKKRTGNGKTRKCIEPESEPILSLQTMCILHLPENTTRQISAYSSEFINDCKKKLWQEVGTHPDPLTYNISTIWI